MRVVHVNTSPYGGAAKGAIGQHLSLLQAGVNSKMLFLFGNVDNIPHAQLLQVKFPFYKRVLIKLGLYQTQNMKNIALKKKVKGKFEFISFPWSDFRLDLNKSIQEADIVNLHWVSNFLDYPSFFKNIKKPVTWTLHDMNPFLGIYHFSDDESNNSQNQIIDNEIRQIKSEAIKSVKKIRFICPSSWMLQEVKHSILKEIQVNLVPYSVNLDIFAAHPTEIIRKELGIPIDRKVILFVSDKISTTRKGFDILKEALDKIESKNLLLIAIGSQMEDNYNFNHEIIMPGRIDDEKILAKYYAAADAFILPSRQDNLPNVMLESLACGTPVISFNIGGMRDFVVDEECGILAKSVNAEGLSIAINKFLEQGVNWSRDEIRNFAIENFSPEKQAALLMKAYRALI